MPIEKRGKYTRIRIKPPRGYVRYRIIHLGIHHHRNIHVPLDAVIGVRPGGGSEIQSVLAPRGITHAQAVSIQNAFMGR